MKHFLRLFLVLSCVLLLSTSIVEAITIVRKAGAKVKMTDSYRNELLASGEKLKKGHHMITLLTEYSPKQFEKIGGRSGHSDEVRNGEVKLLENSDAFYLWWVQYCDEYVPDHGINRQTVVGLTDELYYFSASDLAEVLPESTVSPSLMTQKGSCAFWKDGWEKNGFSVIDGFRWSGDVSEGFLDGSGEGYCVHKEGDDRNLYFVKGTFKRGMPVGTCKFIVIRLNISYFMRLAVEMYNNTESELAGIKDYSSFIIYDQTTGSYQQCKKIPGPFYMKYDMHPNGTVLGPSDDNIKDLEAYADSFLSILTDEYSVENLKLYEAQAKKKISPTVKGMSINSFYSVASNVAESLPENSPLAQKLNTCRALDDLYSWFCYPDYGIAATIQGLEKASNNIPVYFSEPHVREYYHYHEKHPLTAEYDKLLRSPYFTKNKKPEVESYIRSFFAKKNKLVDDTYEKCLAVARKRLAAELEKQADKYDREHLPDFSSDIVYNDPSTTPQGDLVPCGNDGSLTYEKDGYIYFKYRDKNTLYVPYNIVFDSRLWVDHCVIGETVLPIKNNKSVSFGALIATINSAYMDYSHQR